jgi:hypothetical protein
VNGVLAAIVAVGAALISTASTQSPAGPIVITLERTACFGTCPVYTVTVRDDGSVSYDGRSFVRVPGKYAWQIDPAMVRALADEMTRAGFFDLKKEYTAMITDMPTTYTTLSIGARTKRVKDYFDAPPKLMELEKRIDEVSGAKGYVRMNAAGLREKQKSGWRATDGIANAWLWSAATQGDAGFLRALLDAGANAKTVNPSTGVSLVMEAAASGDADTVQLLLKADADGTLRDRGGRNAADRARDGLEREKTSSRPVVVVATGKPAQFDLILKLLTEE